MIYVEILIVKKIHSVGSLSLGDHLVHKDIKLAMVNANLHAPTCLVGLKGVDQSHGPEQLVGAPAFNLHKSVLVI